MSNWDLYIALVMCEADIVKAALGSLTASYVSNDIHYSREYIHVSRQSVGFALLHEKLCFAKPTQALSLILDAGLQQ